MPTQDRRAFVGRVVERWKRQDHPDRGLVIVDTGRDDVQDVARRASGSVYVRAQPGVSIGAARNLACTAARGSIIAHWDDDDWMRPDRLTRQVQALAASGADVCGLARLTYVDRPLEVTRRTDQSRPRPHARHRSLCEPVEND